MTQNSKYAPGTQAWGRCQRCSLRFLLRDLVFDGYMPGLRVCVDCYDPRHPQESLQDTADPVGLWQPSPEFGPVGPVLSITQGVNENILNWTAADPAGGPNILNYTVFRAVSYDGGLNYQPYVEIYNVVVQYDAFGAIIFQPTHPLDYIPYVPPGEVIVDPYTYTDTAVEAGLHYQYYVAAYITKHRYVPSNVVQASSILVLEYLTSRPYPYDFVDSFQIGFLQEKSDYINDSDPFKVAFTFQAGEVDNVLITYSYYAPEPLKTGFVFESGTVFTALITYSYYAPEPIKTAFVFESGFTFNALITYSNYPPEPIKTGFLFTAGSVM